MKILFYLNRYPGLGGIENVTARLCESFAERLGYECAVFSLTRQEGVDNGIHSGAVIQHVYGGAVSVEQELQRFIEDFMPDVVIFQDSYAEVEKPLLKIVKEKGLRLIVCEHNTPDCHLRAYREHARRHSWRNPVSMAKKLSFPYFYSKMWVRTRRRKLRLVRAAEHYVLLSRMYYDILHRLFGIKGDNITAIGNSVRAGAGSPLSEEERADKLLFVGRVTADKGACHLMDVYGKVKREIPQLSLRVVGDGDLLPRLQSRAVRENIADVEFTGYCSDPYAYYSEASMLIMPSSFEGFPLVLAEAMQHGVIPVVYDSFAALHELVTPGKNGYIVPPGDRDGICAAIRRFRQLPVAERESMRRAAMESTARFSPENILVQWRRLIEESLA